LSSLSSATKKKIKKWNQKQNKKYDGLDELDEFIDIYNNCGLMNNKFTLSHIPSLLTTRKSFVVQAMQELAPKELFGKQNYQKRYSIYLQPFNSQQRDISTLSLNIIKIGLMKIPNRLTNGEFQCRLSCIIT